MKLLLIIDKPYHNELKDYLISLKGINDVKINNDNYLEVNINYDDKIIDDKIILKEIYLFLDIYIILIKKYLLYLDSINTKIM